MKQLLVEKVETCLFTKAYTRNKNQRPNHSEKKGKKREKSKSKSKSEIGEKEREKKKNKERTEDTGSTRIPHTKQDDGRCRRRLTKRKVR